MQISYYKRTKAQLDCELREIASLVKDENERFFRATACIHACLAEFKEHLLENPFVNVWEEIYFFKRIKPVVLSELMFQISVHEYRNCPGWESIRVSYLSKQLNAATRLVEENKLFSVYVVSKRTDMDEYFFVRGEGRLRTDVPCPEEVSPILKYCEPKFSTSYDFLLALLITGARLEAFARRELELLMPKLLN